MNESYFWMILKVNENYFWTISKSEQKKSVKKIYFWTILENERKKVYERKLTLNDFKSEQFFFEQF